MPDDDLIAIHESGHAFMAVALGLALDRVQIGDSPRYDLADGLSHSRLDLVRVLMGDPAAEEVVFGEAIGDVSDLKQIRDMLRDGDDEHVLRDQVRKLLALNEGTVKYLAAKLVKSGSMTGREVERAVRGPAIARVALR